MQGLGYDEFDRTEFYFVSLVARNSRLKSTQVLGGKVRDPLQKKLFEQSPERAPFWQTRFYDFNVWTNKKRAEKLDYMHFNPVKRGLAADPGDWRWSSDRFSRLDERGPVRVNEGWAKISFSARTA